MDEGVYVVSDPISGIPNMIPTYPVKPAQRPDKDGESGKHNPDSSVSDDAAIDEHNDRDDDNDNELLIDEYV